jgi:hypothetical protein
MKTLALTSALVLTFCLSGFSTLKAQNLTWSAPQYDFSIEVNGISGRQTPAGVVFPITQRLYMTYTSNNSTGDVYGDKYLYFGSQTGGGAIYGPPSYLNPSGGSAISNTNPGMGVFNNKLYVVMNTIGSGSTGPGYGPAFVSSSDGVNWGIVTGISTGVATDSAPGVASDGTYLYMGFRNAGDHTLVLCRMNASEVVTCTNFPGTRTMGFNPGLKVFNGALYVGFQDLSSHNLEYYKSTDQGQTIGNLITTAANDQTSTPPSLETHNGYLYMGFRTNDGDHKFLYKYSADGTNWTSGPDPHYTMGGAPVLVDGVGLQYYSNFLYNLFSQNGSPYYLYSSYGQ